MGRNRQFAGIGRLYLGLAIARVPLPARLGGLLRTRKRGTTVGRRQLLRQYDEQQPPTPRDASAPRVRADCIAGPRPCPYMACRYHLFTETRANGSLFFPWGLDVGAIADMEHTCALDEADNGAHTYREIGQKLNIVAEAVRGIEAKAMAKVTGRLRRGSSEGDRLPRTES